MPDSTIQLNGDGLKITVRGASTRFGGLDVRTAAIVALIEEADTHFEEKRGNDEAAPEFYATVLAAVARHYADTAAEFGDDVDEDRQSGGAILERLLGELRAAGRL